MLIRKGHASVKIYRGLNRGRVMYTLVNVGAKGRERRMFADLDEAKREAGTVVHNLASGDAEAAKLTGQERQMYLAANKALLPTGVSLVVAAEQFADAHKRLGEHSLAEAVKYFLAHTVTDRPVLTVAEAVAKFAADKAETNKSKLYLKDIRVMLTNGLAAAFPCNLADVSPDDLAAYLQAKKCGPVAKGNHRRLIVAFFNYAKGKKWLDPNVTTSADSLSKYSVADKEVEIYTPEEMAKLMRAADKKFLPYVALLGFGGVRREEMHKGLAWESVDFESKTLIVPATIAKTRIKRKISMPENLAAWLAPYEGSKGPIFAADPRKRMASLAKRAGVTWKRNALRHGYGSYMMETVRNAGDVSLQMGNSADVVKKHYHEIVTAKAAKAYWGITPAN